MTRRGSFLSDLAYSCSSRCGYCWYDVVSMGCGCSKPLTAADAPALTPAGASRYSIKAPAQSDEVRGISCPTEVAADLVTSSSCRLKWEVCTPRSRAELSAAPCCEGDRIQHQRSNPGSGYLLGYCRYSVCRTPCLHL